MVLDRSSANTSVFLRQYYISFNIIVDIFKQYLLFSKITPKKKTGNTKIKSLIYIKMFSKTLFYYNICICGYYF